MRRTLAAAAALLVAVAVFPAAGHAAESCTGAPSSSCLLPFPNDAALTTRDMTTPTGRRVALRTAQMPRNARGVAIDVTDYNRADGFSPGAPIVARVPALSTPRALRRAHVPPVTDIGAYRRGDAGVLLLDATTGKRFPIWVELDRNAARRPQLLINPGRNLRNGRRYVVVIRGLGTRAPRFTLPGRLRPTLRKAKVARGRSVYLAWDFTVASRRSEAGRALSIRDRAFAALGGSDLPDGRIEGRAPGYTISGVTDFTPLQNANTARTVTGTVTVPCFLDTDGCTPGGRFRYDSDAAGAGPVRTAGNVTSAAFACNVPRSATAARPARVALYGHGLLGSIAELDQVSLQQLSGANDIMFCATRWAGFAREDIGTVAAALADLSRFPVVPDGTQQGFLDMLYLGRLLAHPQGLAQDPAFRAGDGAQLLRTGTVGFYGNSQGGILGGALTALAPDTTRSVLGVPGMRFSVLLPRSADFDAFRPIFDKAYPNRSDEPLILSLLQQLWDRGEADGYANQMTDSPLPDTPEHKVLLHPAVGDHQVSTVTADVEARTIGAQRTTEEVARSSDDVPLWGIHRIRSLPYHGSAIVYWDSGNPLAPTTNTPPRVGHDPHGDPRDTPAAQDQIAAFLEPNGQLVDVCRARPCRSAAFSSSR